MNFFSIEIPKSTIEIYAGKKEELFRFVRGELLSNFNIYNIIGNNPVEFLEDALSHHIEILATALKYSNLDIFIKNLSLLYRKLLNKGFSLNYIEMELMAWRNAISAVIFKEANSLLSLYDLILKNIDQLIESDNLFYSKYLEEKELIEQIQYFISLIMEENLNELLKFAENYINNEDSAEKIYTEIILPSTEKLKNLVLKGIFDFTDVVLAFSTINNFSSMLLNEFYSSIRKKISITFIPFNEPIDQIFNIYHQTEASLISDYFNIKGLATEYIRFDEFPSRLSQFQTDALLVIGLNIFNIEEALFLINKIKKEDILSKIQILLYGQELEEFPEIAKEKKELICNPLKAIGRF